MKISGNETVKENFGHIFRLWEKYVPFLRKSLLNSILPFLYFSVFLIIFEDDSCSMYKLLMVTQWLKQLLNAASMVSLVILSQHLPLMMLAICKWLCYV